MLQIADRCPALSAVQADMEGAVGIKVSIAVGVALGTTFEYLPHCVASLPSLVRQRTLEAMQSLAACHNDAPAAQAWILDLASPKVALGRWTKLSDWVLWSAFDAVRHRSRSKDISVVDLQADF